MNVQWRTAIYVTGYSTKGNLDTRLDRWTCTHEQEYIKTLWTNTGLSKSKNNIHRASAGRSSIRHWRKDLTNDEKKCNSFRQFDESIKSTYFK